MTMEGSQCLTEDVIQVERVASCASAKGLHSATAMSIDMSEILPEVSNRDWGAENWVSSGGGKASIFAEGRRISHEVLRMRTSREGTRTWAQTTCPALSRHSHEQRRAHPSKYGDTEVNDSVFLFLFLAVGPRHTAVAQSSYSK